ncbi:MAG TPA: hypothetical protein VD833_12070 [Vicinamibacterales bacterium]|nr:hypothetical protein [Vicinamibacterales bacterium]
MLTIEVHPATAEEQTAVIGGITLAFGSDPMARWSLPDPATYLVVIRQIARAFGGNGFPHGTAHLLGNGCAAAMWLPPGVYPDSKRLAHLMEQHAPPRIQPENERGC